MFSTFDLLLVVCMDAKRKKHGGPPALTLGLVALLSLLALNVVTGCFQPI